MPNSWTTEDEIRAWGAYMLWMLDECHRQDLEAIHKRYDVQALTDSDESCPPSTSP